MRAKDGREGAECPGFAGERAGAGQVCWQLPATVLGMDGLSMTRWEVERDARGWSVVAWRDGQRVEPRRTLTGLACITARVLRDELEHAYDQGRVNTQASIFEALGD